MKMSLRWFWGAKLKFSFVIPVYKKDINLFRDCLKSLKGQSYKNIEIVCVFDGEDKILKDAARNELKDAVLVTIKHAGACAARNEGFKHTSGDFVSFWDADCVAEPEMVNVWKRYLELDPSLDFVYSGYKWLDPRIPGYESEPFDPWTLERYNYIASMFPCKREKVVKWDEDLKSLQDWDYWRRIVKAGGKGEHIPGFGFSTEVSGRGSISGEVKDRQERIRIVRDKHNDIERSIHVISNKWRIHGINIAKIIDADIFNGSYWYRDGYKLVLMAGFDALDVLNNRLFFRNGNAKKVIYWVGFDAQKMYEEYPYKIVHGWISEMKKNVSLHWCDDRETRNVLLKMGIHAEVVPFPRIAANAIMTLPEKFKVLIYSDDHYSSLLGSIKKAMPDIEFDVLEPGKNYKIEDYSLCLQFTISDHLENGSKNMLMCGRYLLSNVQEPYSGFVRTKNRNLDDFKDEVIERIREVKRLKAPNTKAQEYYLGLTDPRRFREKVCELTLAL